MLTRLVVLAGAVALVAASQAAATASPRLELLRRDAPFTVRGLGFVPREHVTVTIVAPVRRSMRVVTSRSGAFLVRLDVSVDRCSALVVRAAGSRGDRAVLRPQPQCPPP